MYKHATLSADSAASLPTIRIVVADDHPIVRAGIVQELSRQPDIVVLGEAVNGTDTVACVRAMLPDVLVLDINMPGLRAVEVLRQIEVLPRPPQTLVLTGYTDLEHILAMLKARAKGYVLKDEDPAAIIDAVRAVSRGETWLSRAVANSLVEHTVSDQAAFAEPDFSEREADVLRLLAEGKGNQAIGAALDISERTVRYHLNNIYSKLGVQSRGEAIAWSAQKGLGNQPGGARDDRRAAVSGAERGPSRFSA